MPNEVVCVTEKVMSCLFLLFSLVYIFFARELSFGTVAAPKAGFLPMLAGITAAILSIVIISRQLLEKRAQKESPFSSRKLFFVLVGLVLYVILLGVIGYVFATLIITLYLLKVTDTAGWFCPCSVSLGLALGFYYVFEKFLGTNLP